MGIILGKLRKKKSTCEILEKLDAEIKSIEEFRRNTEQSHKKIVGRFILTSAFVYLLTAIIFYFYFFPASVYERLIYVIPLVSAPLIIVSVKRALTWYYNRKLKKNHDKLVSLRAQKKKMLDTVMETETYKVAKSILEKYAPEQVRKTPSYNESTPAKVLTPALPSSIAPSQSGLRYRSFTQQQAISRGRQSFGGAMTTPLLSRAILPPPTVPSKTQATQSLVPVNSRQLQAVPTGSPVRLTRAILPRERSVLDKMVDYLVGDGPSNRYALICKQCSSHNGMALKEEFEYLSFRCCYCSTFNPARKQKPAAPKLEFEVKTSPRFNANSDTSESERHSQSSTDSEGEASDKNKCPTKGIRSSCDLPDRRLSDREELLNVKLSDTEKLSDTKLSDTEKASDNELKFIDDEATPMEVDASVTSNDTAKSDVIDSAGDTTESCPVSYGIEDSQNEEIKEEPKQD